MGGELEKTTMNQKTGSKLNSKAGRNHKSKIQLIGTESPSKKSNAKTANKTTPNNEHKREKAKKKKEKVSVLSMDKDEINHEKKSIRINS